MARSSSRSWCSSCWRSCSQHDVGLGPMQQVAFWLDVTKALIGTAAGAALGFGSAFWSQSQQRARDRYLAAAAAMETLRTQLDDFHNYQTGFRDEIAARQASSGVPQVPKWAVARPIRFYFFDSTKFDYHALAFFLEERKYKVLGKLRYAERRYHELRALGEAYNELAQRKLVKMSERFVVGTSPQIREVEIHLGPELVGALETTIAGIERHLQSDEGDYRAAISELSSATRALFSKKPLLSVTSPETAPAVRP